MKTRRVMLQGTSSNVGKSVLTAALCRIFKQDGYRVAPFKSQNMALNSFVTKNGGEIGRAQGVQAEAAGVEATVEMNPVLLKPKKDSVAQVIVRGRPVGDMSVKDYIKYKPQALELIKESLENLERDYEVLVIEGAGSPAEVNLKAHDIANMKIAHLADSPVLLVADIDRGGVMASLVGTLALLDPKERERVAGLIINKFRGDLSILQPALDFLEERTGKPVLGVVPFLHDLNIEEEDSVVMTEKLLKERPELVEGELDIVVVHLPHIANFTDLDSLKRETRVKVRYINKLQDLGEPDLIVLPGTKNTVDDLLHLFKTGLAQAIREKAQQGTPIIGICGGYQMLGKKLYDPDHVESDQDIVEGLGLLNTVSTFVAEKITSQVQAKLQGKSFLSGEKVTPEVVGYEIHMGRTELLSGVLPFAQIFRRSQEEVAVLDGAVSANGLVIGTYLHGIFDNDWIRQSLIKFLCSRRSIAWEGCSDFKNQQQLKEEAYDQLAHRVRASLNMPLLYQIMGMKEGKNVVG